MKNKWVSILFIAFSILPICLGRRKRGVFVETVVENDRGTENGIGTKAQFNAPVYLTVDSNDNIYIADSANHSIRIISANGEVSTFAGNGNEGKKDANLLGAMFYSP